MGVLMSKWFSSFKVTRVSSAAMKSADSSASIARGEKSDRFPMGVPVTNSVPQVCSVISVLSDDT